MVVVSLSISEELLKKLDEYVNARGYVSRSEAIREAIREILSEYELNRFKRGKAVAVIAILYTYERTDSDAKLTSLRREFDELVNNDVHIHLGKKYRLELLVAEGEISEIESLIGRVRSIRGILSIKYSVLPLMEEI